MKSVFLAWMVMFAGVCYGGQEAVVVAPAPAVVVAPAPVVVSVDNCNNGCCGNKCSKVYSASTDERSTVRRGLFGKTVRRDVKRTVVTPVR